MDTPVSANTASHMLAQPKSPITITIALTIRANYTFCQEMELVILAMLKASGMAPISEFINTTSAASMAASAPLPIAAPTSAPARYFCQHLLISQESLFPIK